MKNRYVGGIREKNVVKTNVLTYIFPIFITRFRSFPPVKEPDLFEFSDITDYPAKISPFELTRATSHYKRTKLVYGL